MHRYVVTGTDTDVGKTRVTAALARALRDGGVTPTIVKLVQTGLAPDVPGDAQRAGALADVRALELARFEMPTDPWNAALAQGAPPPRARDLAKALWNIEGALVAEGAGGMMVPFNEDEHLGHLAIHAQLSVVLAVGLRLGCINHALLTIALCETMRVPIEGAVLVERWEPTSAQYRAGVMRALQGNVKIFGIMAFAADEPASVEAGARLFDTLLRK